MMYCGVINPGAVRYWYTVMYYLTVHYYTQYNVAVNVQYSACLLQQPQRRVFTCITATTVYNC